MQAKKHVSQAKINRRKIRYRTKQRLWNQLHENLISNLATYLQAHLLITETPLLCCEPQLAGVANVTLPSRTSIAVATIAVEGQDSTIAELLRRAAGYGTYSRKTCHQAA